MKNRSVENKQDEWCHKAVGLAGLKYQNQQRPSGLFSLTVGTYMNELSLLSRTAQGFWAPEELSSLLRVPGTFLKGEEEIEAEKWRQSHRALQGFMKDSRNRYKVGDRIAFSL